MRYMKNLMVRLLLHKLIRYSVLLFSILGSKPRVPGYKILEQAHISDILTYCMPVRTTVVTCHGSEIPEPITIYCT